MDRRPGQSTTAVRRSLVYTVGDKLVHKTHRITASLQSCTVVVVAGRSTWDTSDIGQSVSKP